MKSVKFILLFSVFMFQGQAQIREYYQLKTYSFETVTQEETTDNYLEHAFIPALKELDIHNVGVFKPRPTDSITPRKTYVLIPFTSLVQFRLLEEALARNKKYLEAGKTYLNAAHDTPPYTRINSVLMKAFKDMPKMSASKLEGPLKDRVYELRSYESATETKFKNKVQMFNEGGEVKLFDRLDFNAVFYAEVLSGPKMPNLMYMIRFDNEESRASHWKTFVDSPEWNALKVDPKYQNNISHIDALMLYPTAYSAY